MKCEAIEKTDNKNVVRVCQYDMVEVGDVMAYQQNFGQCIRKMLQCPSCKSIRIE